MPHKQTPQKGSFVKIVFCYTNCKYKMESTITIISWHKLYVEKAQENCECSLWCTDCQIYLHNYTCLDSILHTTVCKHVTFYIWIYMQKDTKNISEYPTLLVGTNSYYTSLLSDKKLDTSLTQTKTTLLRKLQKFWSTSS